jgi:hypothetical protein
MNKDFLYFEEYEEKKQKQEEIQVIILLKSHLCYKTFQKIIFDKPEHQLLLIKQVPLWFHYNE